MGDRHAAVADGAELRELLAAWSRDPELAEELALSAAAGRGGSASPVAPEQLPLVLGTAHLVSTSDAANGCSSQSPKMKPKFASTWARQKHEMEALKREIEELTAVLQWLRLPPSAKLMGGGDDGLDVQSVFQWRQRADREREGLKRSQYENTRLRLGVVEGERAVKSLRRSVLNRAAQHARLAELVDLKASAHLCREFAPTLDDAAMLRKAIAGLAEMHVSVDGALHVISQKLPPLCSSFREWVVQPDVSGSTELEMVASHEVPFLMREVEDALQALQLKDKPSRQTFESQDFGGPRDVLVQTSNNPLQAGNGVGSRRAHQATHLLTGAARSVSVSDVYVTLTEQSRHPTPDIVLRVRTWVILSPIVHVDAATGRESHATSLRTLSKATPLVLRRAWPVRWERSTIEKIVIPSWDRAMVTNQQRLENTLVDRCMLKSHLGL